MPKTPPFIIAAKQPSRSMKNHGKHRRTSPPVHSSSADGAGAGKSSRAHDAIYAFTRNRAPGAINSIDPRVTADHAKMMRELIAYAMAQMQDWPKLSPPLSPSIPNIGIVAGEIIAKRLWHIFSDGSLCSLAHLHIWEPGVTQTGNLDEVVAGGMMKIYGGVYAFKQDLKYHIYAEVEDLKNRLAYAPYSNVAGRTVIGFALGTVKLWGEVVEHEVGYRASFAKIEKIERTWFKPHLKTPPRKLAAYGIDIPPPPTYDSSAWTGT